MLKAGGNSTNIRILAGGVLFFAIAVVSIWSLFSMTVTKYITIGSIAIGVIIGLMIAYESPVIGIIVGFIAVIVFAFIATLAVDYTFIFAPVCVLLGVLLILWAVKKINVVRSSDGKILQIKNEINMKFTELEGCYYEEIEAMRGYPACKKYRISIPYVAPDFSAYHDNVLFVADD